MTFFAERELFAIGCAVFAKEAVFQLWTTWVPGAAEDEFEPCIAYGFGQMTTVVLKGFLWALTDLEVGQGFLEMLEAGHLRSPQLETRLSETTAISFPI